MHCLAYYDKIAPYSTQIFRINSDNSGIIIHYDAWKNQIQVFDFKSNKGVSYTLYAKTVYSFDLIYEGNNSYKILSNPILSNFKKRDEIEEMKVNIN